MSSKIKVVLKKGLITEPESHRKIVHALGLKRIGGSKVHKDNNCIRGMVNKVRHLVAHEFVN